MTTQSTNIPRSSDQLTKRKAMIVRIVQPLPSLPGYDEKAAAYWDAARMHVGRQEASIGPYRQVFVEGVMGHGADGMLAIQQANPGLHRFVKSFVDDGATLAPLEDTNLLLETADWSECLNVQPRSEKVQQLLIEKYNEAAEARNAHLNTVLGASIGIGEAAIVVVISDSLPLPPDVERFLVSPPELDQLNRWLREQLAKAQQEYIQATQASDVGNQNQAADQSGSQLWTPP